MPPPKIDLTALRTQLQAQNFSVRPHALQHAVKEGFTVEDMVHVVMRGKFIEAYPDRQRILLSSTVMIEDVHLTLHVVCEHRFAESPVDFVTAYIPNAETWETPTKRRKKR